MQTTLENKEIFTVKDFSKISGMSEGHIHRLTRNKKIPHSKPGGKLIFFTRENIINFLLSNPQETAEETEVKANTYAAINKGKGRAR